MKIKDFKFPLIQFENLNHYFLKYLISSKEPNDFAFNQTNFLIIMGPEGVGKSWFIKYNLKTLFDTELTPKPKVITKLALKNVYEDHALGSLCSQND